MPSVLGNTPLDTNIALASDLSQSLTAVTGKPYDAEVEYVTFPAGAHVDPGVDITFTDVNFDIRFRLPSDTTEVDGTFRCGWWTGNGQTSFQLYILSSNLVRYYGGTSQAAITTSAYKGSFVDASVNGLQFSVNSETNSFVRSPLTIDKQRFGIVGVYVNGVILDCISSVDVAYAKLSTNGIGIFDLLPVRVGTVGYLYDKVTGRLFGSATSTALVPGPDVSTPTFTPKTEIDLLAPLASPALTGTPTAPTAASGTNTTQVATTAFVQTAIASAVQDLDLSIVSGKLCVSFEE